MVQGNFCFFPIGCNPNHLVRATQMHWENKSKPWLVHYSGVKSLNSHLIRERLYSRGGRGNQLHPDNNENRNMCWNAIIKETGKGRAAACAHSYLTPIDSIQASLAFVTLKRKNRWKKRKSEWVLQLENIVRSKVRRSGWAYLEAFVPPFALQKNTMNQNRACSGCCKTMRVIISDSTLSPRGPRSPYKHRNTHQCCHHTVFSKCRNKHPVTN